jgi:LysM repeat protein
MVSGDVEPEKVTQSPPHQAELLTVAAQNAVQPQKIVQKAIPVTEPAKTEITSTKTSAFVELEKRGTTARNDEAPEFRPQFRTHVVIKGETFALIGIEYGVDSAELMKINGFTNPRKLEIGTALLIPDSRNIAVRNAMDLLE